MTQVTFPYIERQHPIFGLVKRPLLKLEFYSLRFNLWVAVDDILVDTGADISTFPLPLGQLLIAEIEAGQPIHLGGVVISATMFNAYVHLVQARLGQITFDLPIAIVTSTAVPPILGRHQALDRFTIQFVQGQETIIEI